MIATITTATTGATTTRTSTGASRLAGADALWRAMGWLYSIQAANLVLPLIAVPFLARTLGPEAWGRVAAAQSFAMLVGLMVEFGFNLSAARMVAQQRGDRNRLAETFAAVTAAQLLLLAVALVLATAVRTRVPHLARDSGLFWSAMLWMIPQVISFQWYYQGVEQMPRLAALTLAGRAAGLAGVLWLVQGPADAQHSLLAPGATGLLMTVMAGLGPVWRLRPALPRPGAVRRVLADGRGLCCYRAGTALQGAANSFVLAFFLTPQLLGAYAGAERLVRAAAGLFEPLVLTVFSRVAYLRASPDPADHRQAENWQRSSRRFMLVAGGGLAVILWALAAWLVRLLLGAGYEAATPVVSMLALSPLAGVLTLGAGLNGLAARGEDGALNRVVISAGVLQVTALIVFGGLVPQALPIWFAALTVAGQFLAWRALERVALRHGDSEAK